ncbi:MAG: PAS domain S-box protein [Firmicutes bacterium]|nr:PAS domain S-box protein [Bacillota bacterium]
MKPHEVETAVSGGSELLQQLVVSEQLLRGIFDNAIVPIIVIEPLGKISQANPAFLDLLGYDQEDLPLMDIHHLTSEDDPVLFDRVVAGEIDSYVQEKHYRRKNGSYIDVIVSGSGLKDQKGNLRCVVAVIQDLSIAKALERNLFEEKKMFESLLSHLPVGVNYLKDGRIEYANPAFCRIFDYSETELRGRSLATLLMPPYFRRVCDDINRLYKQEATIIRSEGEGRTKRGQRVFIEFINSLARIDNEDCVIGIVNDLTLSKQLEARYRLLFEAANDIFLVLSLNNRIIIEANPKALEVSGYTREELLGMKVVDLTQPTIKKTGGSGGTPQEEWPVGIYPRVLVRKNGEKIPVDVSSSMADWMGRKAIVSIVRDVTEQRRLQQQLMQADKLASLGSLVAGIAHEINNPNNFISFNIPILEEYWNEVLPITDAYYKENLDWNVLGMSYEEFRSDMLKLLANMQHGSERINNIVSELRDFARVQKDEYRAPTDVRRLINRVMTLTGKQVSKLIHSFEVEVDDGLPDVVMNPARIEQVLINLILNAAQAANKEDSMVRLRVMRNPANRSEICFEVADNGCGMEEHVKKRVFDPFFTTKEGAEGTGLGLSISYAIVEDHRGNITVDSAPDRGTVFRVTLPIRGDEQN